MTEQTEAAREGLDEVRVIVLPPPQTAAVNRLLREESGWSLLETKVVERQAPDRTSIEVVYVMGHRPEGG